MLEGGLPGKWWPEHKHLKRLQTYLTQDKENLFLFPHVFIHRGDPIDRGIHRGGLIYTGFTRVLITPKPAENK